MTADEQERIQLLNSGLTHVYPFIHPDKYRGALTGYNVLITGAGRGIGRSIAIAYAEAGASVACLSRTTEELHSLVDEIKTQHGQRAIPVVTDVADMHAIGSAVALVQKNLGNIDVLVNNAGIDWINPFEDEEQDLDRWWRVMEVNCRAPVELTRHVLPSMLERGRGVIISIGSNNCCFNFPFMTAYSVSKAAVMRFHECLEQEIKGRGVRTFVLQPGCVATGLATAEGASDPKVVGRSPEVRKLLQSIKDTACAVSPRLAASTCIALTADERAGALSGRYIDAQDDLEEAIMDAMSGESRIKNDRLYTLKIDKLWPWRVIP